MSSSSSVPQKWCGKCIFAEKTNTRQTDGQVDCVLSVVVGVRGLIILMIGLSETLVLQTGQRITC